MGFSSARVKIRQIPHVNFELTSQFLFKFCIILHCHDIKLPCKFWAHKFSTLNKRIPSKSQFSDFQTCSGEKWLNSSCHFWKHKSGFLQMLHRYLVPSSKTPLYFFSSNIIYFVIFLAQTLYTLFSSSRVKIRQIPHVNFELTRQFLFKFCIILHCHDT